MLVHVVHLWLHMEYMTSNLLSFLQKLHVLLMILIDFPPYLCSTIFVGELRIILVCKYQGFSCELPPVLRVRFVL